MDKTPKYTIDKTMFFDLACKLFGPERKKDFKNNCMMCSGGLKSSGVRHEVSLIFNHAERS